MYFARPHKCPQGNALRKELGDVDHLDFPVGHAGWGIPKDTPFDVTSVDKCHACGKYVRAWFVWGGATTPGPRLWTP